MVTLDSWANAEYVEDGKTGLLAGRSSRVSRYCPGTSQPNFLAPDFHKAVRVPDPEVVTGLAQKVSQLIEDGELRRRLGKAARWEVEKGKFSLAKINEKLKRVLDEATRGGGSSP